jgi:hypothetical protein
MQASEQAGVDQGRGRATAVQQTSSACSRSDPQQQIQEQYGTNTIADEEG